MGCRIITDKDDEHEVFYCSTTMMAFGPVMYGDAEEFLKWLKEDPRKYDVNELNDLYAQFREEKETENAKVQS